MKRFSVFVSNSLVEQGIINDNDAELCTYGIEGFLTSVVEITSIIFFSIFFGNLLETILFFASFIPLRLYAGGYHASTKINCYLILVYTYIIFSIIIDNISIKYILLLELTSILTTFIMVCIYSPIISCKKKVNEYEICAYRKTSIRILLIEMVFAAVLLLWFPNNKYVLAFTLGQLAVSLSMLAAIVKNKMARR